MNISAKEFYYSVYGKGKVQSADLKERFTELMRIAETFLVIKQTENDWLKKDVLLLKGYYQRN